VLSLRYVHVWDNGIMHAQWLKRCSRLPSMFYITEQSRKQVKRDCQGKDCFQRERPHFLVRHRVKERAPRHHC